MTRPLVFLDTETTGLDPHRHQIWEIAYAVDDGPIHVQVVRHATPALTPDVMAALRVNGYLDRGHEVANSAGFEGDLRAALTDATLVAAQPAFDAAMLTARWGINRSRAPWHYRLFDIESFAAGVLGWEAPQSLATVAAELGITAPDHSAEMDVHVLRECYRQLRKLRTRCGRTVPIVAGVAGPACTLAPRTHRRTSGEGSHVPMTTAAKPAASRPQPTEPCAHFHRVGLKWHCPTTNHQCDWIVCAGCARQYQRSKPARWRPWTAPQK